MMLPDGAHNQDDDSTIFFLNRKVRRDKLHNTTDGRQVRLQTVVALHFV